MGRTSPSSIGIGLWRLRGHRREELPARRPPEHLPPRDRQALTVGRMDEHRDARERQLAGAAGMVGMTVRADDACQIRKRVAVFAHGLLDPPAGSCVSAVDQRQLGFERRGARGPARARSARHRGSGGPGPRRSRCPPGPPGSPCRELASDHARILAEVEAFVGCLAHEPVARPACELGTDHHFGSHPDRAPGHGAWRRLGEC